MPNLYVALTHYPVVNKSGDIITSAVTNLDLHDISRAAKTYGVKNFYVVTPLRDQQVLAQRIIAHWIDGAGAVYNPARRRALETIKVVDSIADVVEDIRRIENQYPKTVATCARKYPSSIGYDKFRAILKSGGPHLLVFGTAWGLAEAFISEAHYILEPIMGSTDYNHLSVRTAAGIILDRILGF
ncbi:MAG: RNA methyltransferase [Desulfobacterales bacterium]